MTLDDFDDFNDRHHDFVDDPHHGDHKDKESCQMEEETFNTRERRNDQQGQNA